MSEKSAHKVLIAEDEQAYSHALVLKLQNAGIAAESVSNGEEALTALKNGSYDLLICDLIMPKMNGFSLLQEIKDSGISLPVVILSNLSQADDEEKVRALGAVGFLSKSNTPIAEVISKVKEFLGGK